jgi:predicted flavoprotein YhiN
MVKLSGIAPERKINSITKEERRKFGELIKAFPVRISGFRPIDEAIITSGGVSVKEIDPKTMESKLVSGLFFAGEVIDVDAYTGGFNLQIAFSTAYSAALYL